MDPDDIFTSSFKTQPYWWEEAPRPLADKAVLPTETDVLVIGAGYTGLMAARETAKGGRSTIVIDSEAAGWGCSSRNGGQVSTSIKPSFAALSGRHNQATAFAIRSEGIKALDFIDDLIRSEKLECDWRQVGRFHAAHNRRQYEALAAVARNQPKGLEVPMEMVPKAEQSREIASDLYYGGAVYPRHGALHPVKFHSELMHLARAAGVEVINRCAATAIDRDGMKFRVLTTMGTVIARDVVLATNGYSGSLSPWHQRRVIPIGSYIIATEPRAPEEMLKLIPNDRVVSDTRRVVSYYRLSPDHRSMLFGGRVAYMETNLLVSARHLHARMTELFPSLIAARVTHSWMGFVAFTFDTLPHVGKHDGIHFAMGYCGSGVSLATYFGMRIGQQVLGRAEGETAMDNVPFPTRPLYTGNPWFLAPSVWWYRLLDRLPL